MEAGDKLWMDHGKLSRIETGQLPEVALLREMLDLYGVIVNDWNPMINLWLRAKEKGWWREFGISNAGYPALEHDACLVRDFESILIPGLLQAEAYMRLVLQRSNRASHSKQWVDNQAEVRRRRALRLYDTDNPLRLHAIIDEQCLHRNFGRKVMIEQLRLIIERSELPNVTVQVVPDRGPYLGMLGAFTVLDYPDPAETGVAFIPHATGAEHLHEVKEVQSCRLDFEHVAKMALSPEESRAFIEEVIAQL
jgi:hypothetical protein